MRPETGTDQEVQNAFAQAPQPARQYVGTSSAFSSSASIEEDWTKISDLAERRRIQNRIAQRNYRKKLKRRLEDLERRAGSTDDAYPYDLTEHEERHSQPWQHLIPASKHHEDGWPTTKELGRHFNDEHSDSQVAMYEIDKDESSAKVEDPVEAAMRYQDRMKGDKVPLTEKVLREASKRGGVPSSRSTRSSASHDNSEYYKRSNTTGFTRSSGGGGDDYKFKVSSSAIVRDRASGPEIECEGGEIIFSAGLSRSRSGSERGSQEEPYIIKCICTFADDDGNTIYCKTCGTWQHIECFYPNNREEAIRKDFAHACANCNSRPLDREKAMKRHLWQKGPFRQKAHGFTYYRGAQKQPLPVLGSPSTTSSANVLDRRQQEPLPSSVANEMETYHGYVRTPDDAIKLFEACRLGLLPRVQRRLSENERQLIRSGSVFIWDEREAGMRRWTDGKSWSASIVIGSFLTYREMERKQGGGFRNDKRNGSKESGFASDEGQHDGEPRDYRYKADGLMKQSFSITTSTGQHLHLVSYYSRPQPGQPEMTQPSSDPALCAVIPVEGMYPKLITEEANQTPALPRAPMLQTYMVPQHPTPGILPSDSGYASVARLKNDSILLPPTLAQQPSGGEDFDASDAQDPATDQRGDQDLSDANTVYSDAVSLSGETKESYIDALVDDLLGKLGDLRSQPDLASRLAKLLPALLKTLALGIGSSSRSHESRDIMVFIHKHRFMIAAALESRLKDEQDEDDKSQSQRHRPTEIMDRWLRSETDVDYNEIPENDLRLGDEGDDDDNETSVPALDEYRKLVHSSCSYFWLVGRLQREMNTSESAPGIDAMERIRADLLAAIPSEDRVSRREAPQPITAVYATQWSIRDFLSNQAYKGPGSQAIANAITLTGTSTDAQALTCSQYLAQTWPSTGHHTLRLMQLLIDHKSVPPVKITVTDPSPMSLEAHLRGGHVAVTTSGLPEYVAEIGQQLAWMSAAMSSSDESTLCENTPFLDHMNPDDVYKRTVSCDINIRTKPYHKPDDYETGGQCWHNMFHNPVIACGFPIRSRSTSTLNTGLEMSLDIMAAMTDTRYINVFNSGTFIKGFSSMLVPTGRSEDVLIWHHLYKKNAGERISYWDFQLPYVDVGMAQLETSRHILGWCSDADSLVGSSSASYDIRRSRLPRTHAGCSLDKVELQAGQFVQATAAFTVGKREKPVHISRNGYLDKLNWISSKYVILWDEGDNAGWLCSGTRGLVHLLRASLEHSKGKFKSSFLMDPKSLPDILNSESIDGMDPALSLLLDRHVRQLRLYVDKDWDGEDMAKGDANSKPQAQYYMLQDRVEHLYYIMEKLIEWQTNTEQRSGLSINACPRKQLEGWDFRDVVAGGDPFFPRVTTLPAVGKGWVDFARSIQAVTLFGRGFGQLMKPRATSGLGGPCRIWSSLPTGRHYLAARLSDLSAITQDHGDPTSNPVYLSDNVIWHVKANAFDPCPCTGTNCPHEPVQVLFPSKFTTRLCKKASPATLLQSNGAVIFGHNKRLRWYWKDFGDPVKGDPEEEVQSDSMSSFEDSALGSSIESARSPSSDLGSLPSTQSATSLSPAGGSWKRGLRDAASSLNKRARRL